VFLDEQVADEHYNGFSNGILWPLFHYIAKGSHFDNQLWMSYCKANREFANVVDSIWKEGDLVWVLFVKIHSVSFHFSLIAR
jgi:trehalose-6-phosphate synthase